MPPKRTSGADEQPAPQMGSRLWSRLKTLWTRIHFYLHWAWLVACVWLFNFQHSVPPRTQLAVHEANEKKKPIVRKLVHIGDEHALGLGDWVVPGAASSLLQYLTVDRHPLILSPWTMQIEAARGATSEQWLPQSERFEACFDATTGRHGSDADIVLITLGANDTAAACSGQRSAENVLQIADELRRRLPGRIVMINIPPIPPAVLNRGDDSTVKRRCIERNVALRELLLRRATQEEARRAAAAEGSGAGAGAGGGAPRHLDDLAFGTLRFGVDLHNLLVKQEEAFCFEGLFLKPRAFKEAARVMQERVMLAQRSLEADFLKNRFS